MHPEKTNFFYLLIALLIMLFTIPLAHDLEVSNAPAVRAVVFSLLLLLGVWSLKGGGRVFTVGMTLAIVGVVFNALAAWFESPAFQYGSHALLISFLLVTVSFALQQVVFDNEINTNRLVGAICVFLLLGVIWALVYAVLERAVPGSFSGIAQTAAGGWDSSWLYFSFVTLTTLGYGDVTPVTATASTLAYLQAVAGQFYVAVLVAGLVSAYISDKQAGPPR